jgi:formylglycine-generating enzyme required for sulfatase activity
MLETKFKVALLLIVLAFAALPVMGILRGTTTTPYEDAAPAPDESDLSQHESSSQEVPVHDDMVTIPAGPFLRGTASGGFDEQPQRSIFLETFSIDRYEVTNHHYQQFAAATGHRKAGYPGRTPLTIADGKASGFRRKRNGKRRCEVRMAGYGPGEITRSRTERTGPGCRTGMK